jgi:rubrerythrin
LALENAAELADVLRRRERLGRIFARHAYGMRAWVDLFSARIAAIDDAGRKALVATLVADNARHMLLFRDRAAAHGIDPDAYTAPAEGETIYERIDELDDFDDLLGYALGSLEHFDELLAVYRAAAEDADAAVIDAVRADVARHRGELRPLVGPRAERLVSEAHERYRVRELVETPRYARAA